jgi:hypothetical protein
VFCCACALQFFFSLCNQKATALTIPPLSVIFRQRLPGISFVSMLNRIKPVEAEVAYGGRNQCPSEH